MSNAFWKLMTVILLVFALAAIYFMFGGKQLYDLFIPRGDVLKTATSTLLRIERENSLVTTTAYVQAVVRQKDIQWYGDAQVVRIVPAKIHYAVNLAEIDPHAMEYDEKARVLYVPLPDIKIQSIDPDLTKAEVIRSIDLFRSESLTGNVLEDTTEKMVRPTLEEMGKSPDITRIARDQALLSVKQLLESALNATGSRVQVRPYFKSEGKKA